jgi:hypothetical protein
MCDFEKCFGDYLESVEADKNFNDFFSAVRDAFAAGFKAAGGEVVRRPQSPLSAGRKTVKNRGAKEMPKASGI